MPVAAPPQNTFDPKLVAPFVKAVRAVLDTMVKVEVDIRRAAIKSHPGSEYDYSAIIAFSGRILGTVVMSFQAKAAEKLVSAFAGVAVPINTPDFADALGELANMVAGAAKRDLGAEASISVPTVVMGRGHLIARPSDVPCLVIPCRTDVGEFAVEVSIKNV